MNAAAQFENVTQVFGDFTAVDGIDMTIPAGKLTTLLGPSGCGKTTSLRMLAGYTRPTSGRILIDGNDVTRTAPEKRGLGMVFQSYALFPHMTVAENVAYGLKLRRVPRPERDARVAESLELVGLGHLASRKPRALSGGQQQRVALARAVVNRPALLLLDEPLGALDLKLRRQMQLELKAIQSEVGLTFLHVTHDQEEAMTMADTVAVMNRGRIEQLGSPQDLYELPKTGFVAAFLGQSNLLPATVVSTGGGLVTARTAGGIVSVPEERAVATSGEITVGVRPEKLTLSGAEPQLGSTHNVLGPGRIVDASFTGASTQYIVDMPGIGPITVFEQNMVFGAVYSAGAEVWVSWRIDHGFGLDAEAKAEAADADESELDAPAADDADGEAA